MHTLFHLLLLLITLHFQFLLLISTSQFPLASQGCHEEERIALLNFKSSLEDPSNHLSSWQEGSQNCCDWHGIGCSNDTFHVIKIDLQNRGTTLGGKISPWLFKITHLEYLDLSGNNFYRQEIPFQFANLSSLQYLDLSDSYIVLLSMEWVRQLVNLKVLRLSGLNLYEATSSGNNFGEHMSYLSNLRDLDLSICHIDNPVSLIQTFHNLSRLYSLKLNGNFNSIASSMFQLHLDNLTSLSILDLSGCELEGSVPHLPQLTELDVSRNGDLHVDLSKMFEHQWPKLKKLWIHHNSVEGSFASAPHLSLLSASYCSIQGSVPSLISNLSQLQFLDLSGNNISGSIATFICNLTHLEYLDLSDNHLTGDIPSCLYKLKNFPSFNFLNAFSQPEPPLLPRAPPPGPPLLRGPQPAEPPPQYNYAIENVLFYGDVALGFIVGFWGLFFGLLLKKEKWWCGYWRFVDVVATRIVRGCRQLIHVCTEMVVG